MQDEPDKTIPERLEKAVAQVLDSLIRRINEIMFVHYSSAEQDIFNDEALSKVRKYFGRDEAKGLARRLTPPTRIYEVTDALLQRDRENCLLEARNRLEVLKARVQRGEYKAPEAVADNGVGKQDSSPKQRAVFLSHSGETPAFLRLERFLRDLGLNPRIAEWLPFQSRSVPENAREAMKGCEAAIVFATKTDRVAKRHQPGRGLLIETGLLQEKFGSRVVYLIEEGAELGPMADNLARESFRQDCLEEAFRRVVIELRSHGLI